jgi:uncharacterized membrane protein
MLKYLITYLGAGVSIAVLDAIYLTIAGQKVYRPTLDYALADKPALPAAIIFYLMYVAGVVVLAILPNKDAGLGKTALTGALLGAFAYATYDLTNQATLKGWSWQVTLADLCWGTFATGVSAALACALTGWISERIGR